MNRLSEPLLKHAADLRYEQLDTAALAATKILLRDTIAVGLAGSSVPLTADVYNTAKTLGSGREARVWVSGAYLPAGGAALVNGYQIHNQEFDCVHEAAVVHPLAVILSALLAAAELRGGVSGRNFLTALVAAVDVATLVGQCARAPMRFFRPAMCGALGASVGIARIEGADAETLRRSFAHMCGQLSGGMQAHVEGSPALALQIGLNARAAHTAWAFAAAGFPAPHDVLEGTYGYLPMMEGAYDTAAALDTLARGEAQVTQVSLKPFPTGRAAHGTLDMLGELCAAHRLRSSDIEYIELSAPPLIQRLINRPWRADMSASYARLCLPYLVATFLREGRVGLDAYSEEQMRDEGRADFATRVSVVGDGSNDPNALVPQSLTVRLRSGPMLSASRTAVLGAPERPLSEAQALAKFHHCLDHSARPFDAPRRDALLSTIDRIETLTDMCQLIDLMMIEC
jgi:aconitate decarboxylase